MQLISRNGNDVTAAWPELADLAAIAAMVAVAPATFVAFHLLHVGDRSLIELPYLRRRELLEQLALPGPRWQISPRMAGRGRQLLAPSQEVGLEGLILKRLDGRYLPGRRSRSWTKIKNCRSRR
ncbi:hypothetical protein [Nocardia sp. AB354]|uniref:ATP-dependent DNA ligase n=1 Tax=Nocardia sp. AB354 TaxID=3413283 RepID=UPI003C15B2A5